MSEGYYYVNRDLGNIVLNDNTIKNLPDIN